MAHDPRRYDPAASGHNFVHWSPYAGIELPYRPIATFLRGRLAYDGKDVLAEPGRGAFVRPPAIAKAPDAAPQIRSIGSESGTI